jgi:hypothetical protein
MQKFIRTSIAIAALTILVIGLNGCAPKEPEVFGVPQSQWSQLTPEQQNAAIQGYNERKRIEKVNEPLNAAIDVADTAIWRQQNKF